MINSTAYGTTLPSQASSSTTVLTSVPSTTAGETVFKDLTLTSGGSLTIRNQRTEKAKEVRIYSALRRGRRYVNSDLNIENPYENMVSISITYDPRYASTAEVKADVASMFNRLLNVTSGGSATDIERMISGEL